MVNLLDFLLKNQTKIYILKLIVIIFLNQSSSNLYIQVQLQWLISGEKEKVREINAKQIGFVEKNLQIIGLGAYLRFNYLQFYQE